jgi:hypothetical protein
MRFGPEIVDGYFIDLHFTNYLAVKVKGIFEKVILVIKQLFTCSHSMVIIVIGSFVVIDSHLLSFNSHLWFTPQLIGRESTG